MLSKDNLSVIALHILFPPKTLDRMIPSIKLGDFKMTSFTSLSTTLKELSDIVPHLSFHSNIGYMYLRKNKIDLYISKERPNSIRKIKKKMINDDVLRKISQDLNYLVGLCSGKFDIKLNDIKIECEIQFTKIGLPINFNKHFNQAFLTKIGANSTAIELSCLEKSGKKELDSSYLFQKGKVDSIRVSHKYNSKGPIDIEELVQRSIEGANRLIIEIGEIK